MGDLHQSHLLDKPLSIVLVVLTLLSSWAMYQISPDADAGVMPPLLVCTVERKDYPVGSAKVLVTGQILECLSPGKNLAPQWHKIERSRIR
ncbi:hypothetical protein ACXX82_17245 [Glaciimonas sp. GNP009]